jgi:uncharacterized membrane protein (UPF0127 family)
MTSDTKSIVNLTRGTVVCEHTVIADQALRRMRGLLLRPSLPAGEGLLLQPAPSVHTVFMRFPIDVIFLDRNLQVVKLVERLAPWRAASARHARAALELASGEASARRLEIGDRLQIVTATASIEATATDGDGSREWPLKASHRATGSIHVLVAGTDRRFRSVTSALLIQRGCKVTVSERMDLASVRAKRERAEVVVIDADSSPTAAAREAAEIQKLEPPVGVVLVGDKRISGAPFMPILAKWSFDELYGAITRARPNRYRRTSNGGR